MTIPAIHRRGTGPPADGRQGRHRSPGGGLRVALGAAVLLAFLTILCLLPAFAARARLQDGRAELERGRDLLLEGDVDGARDAFDRSEEEFRAAAQHARSPVLRATGMVPLLGRSTDAIGVLADAGRVVAHAGGIVTGAIDALPDGLGSLAPAAGAMPIEAISSLEPALSEVRANLEDALAEVEVLPTSFIVGSVASARDEALHGLRRAVEASRAAESLTVALPDLLGANGERRYFLAAQTSAELRGTGGLIGAWSILHASDGRLELEPMRSIDALRDLSASAAPPPPATFGAPFDRFGGPGIWRNLNMGPHAPTAARLIESLYRAVTGEPVDGVVLVDAQALAEMLEATGPVRAPAIDRKLEEGTVVEYLANIAYFEFGDQAERKRVLGAAVHSVWTRFLHGAEPIAALGALADATAGGHLIVHSADPLTQEALSQAGVTGSLETPGEGSLFAVFTSNADGTKVDYYMHRQLRYEIELEPEGGGSLNTTITFINRAPTDAEPGYVFGPFPGTGLGAGDSRSFVVTYCGPGCELAEVARDGTPSALEAHSDRGNRVFSTFVRTDAGSTSVLNMAYEQTQAWRGDELGGTYRLNVRGQATVQPTTATVTIRVPQGMRIVDTSVPMTVDGDEATWTGTLGREQRFEIRFQKPFPARMWALLWDRLSAPVVEL